MRDLAGMLLLALMCASALADDPSLAVRRIADYGIAPTRESLADYLATLRPSPERQRELRDLIARLGESDFARREEASRQLLRQIGGAAPLLAEAIAGDNAEIRWRAKLILDQTERDGRALLSAVLAVIVEQKVSGLAGELLDIVSHCPDDAMRLQLRRSLTATADATDAAVLRKALTAADPHVRVAAVGALATVLGAGASGDALSLLADPSEEVQAAAARELANLGRRESLAVLVRLLDSQQAPIRSRAIQTLRAATGQHLDFVALAPPEQRSAAVSAWQKWLEREGMTATLAYPLKDVPISLGRLLICDYQANQLVEFDAAGKKTWEIAVAAQPWACVGLPSGHRLVGSYVDKSIVEYDNRGQEVWRVAGLSGGPTSVQRLENGNTLVACTEGNEVVEIDPAKKIVWRAGFDENMRPVDARRLENGHTLVTLQQAQKVVELDSRGKSVWEIGGVGQAFSAERLESGNTLVCAIGHNKVREFDTAGRVVWERGALTNPYMAQRLPSGNTLVVDSSGVQELDPEGTVVSRLTRPNISRAWKY